MRRLLFLVLSAAAFAGCRPDREPTVIMVGLDGFRHDYLSLYEAPTLSRLAAGGVTTDSGIVSVFPSKTFPNFYSIATGLYPARHGIVANTMHDGERDAWFRISDRDAVEDPAWWQGEPIWITAEKQGVRAANFYWVGSETTHEGLQSTFWKRFDATVPGEARVDTVLAWLDLPPDRRPRLVTLYFSDTDSKGHWDGPESASVEEAVERIDAWIARLVAGLEARGIMDSVDLVVTADHGMAAVSPDRYVVLEDWIDPTIGRLSEASPNLLWDPGPDRVAEVVAALDRIPNVTRLDAETLDSLFGYSGNPRIPPVVAVADEGWTIFRTREDAEQWSPRLMGGMHGYDPRLASQRGLFLAHGPSFRPGTILPSFTNVDVYPLVAHLLGLVPADVDGSLESTRDALRKTP